MHNCTLTIDDEMEEYRGKVHCYRSQPSPLQCVVASFSLHELTCGIRSGATVIATNHIIYYKRPMDIKLISATTCMLILCPYIIP